MSTSSYGSEFENYEQLEILGDAVLKLLASL
jgi:dsRNA-specific ribonuclease